MPVEPALIELARRAGAFHVTARGLKRAQQAIDAAIESGTVDESLQRRYLDEVRRYFEGFDVEARAQLRDVDRRLERVNQVQFNLTAERGVAVKRIEATQAVLEALGRLGAGAA